jgi:hypothetical protein
MHEKILEEANRICEEMFPDDELAQNVLGGKLARFAEFVDVCALLKFRDEIGTTVTLPYRPDEVRHG